MRLDAAPRDGQAQTIALGTGRTGCAKEGREQGRELLFGSRHHHIQHDDRIIAGQG
jgi:hypothetical protein